MPRMTSTSCMTGTGFMKCIPMNASGRRVAAARRVIEIEDVFDARIASGLQAASRLPEEVLLDGLVLDDRLDDRVHAGQRLEPRRRRDAPERRGLLVGRALAPGDLALQVLLDPGPGLFEEALFDVHERDGQAGGRRDVRDAAAHLPAADDAERPEFHGRTLSDGRRETEDGREDRQPSATL